MTELKDKPIYFQWQNDALRETIYPLREAKLRDFLVYFYEIEIWEGDYSKKKLEDIPDEVALYQESQKEIRKKATDDYGTLKKYFELEDVTKYFKLEDIEEYFKLEDETDAFQKAKSKLQPDEKYLRDIINNVHIRFNVFYSKKQSIRREKNLIIDRKRWLEKHRKSLQYELSEQQRTLRNNPNHKRKYKIKGRIDQLELVTLTMAQMEIQRIKDFLNAFGKVEKNRVKLDKWQKQKSKELPGKENKQKKLKTSESELQRQITDLKRSIQPLRKQNAVQKMESYFTDEDVLDDYRRLFPKINEELVASINRAHKWFNDEIKKNRKLDQIIRRSLPKYTRTWVYTDPVRKRMADYEIGLMEEYIAIQGKNADQIASVISKKENKRKELERELSKLKGESQALGNELKLIKNNLNLEFEEQLEKFSGFQEVTIRDIARGKVEDYKNLLAPKNATSMPVVANREITLKSIKKSNNGQPPRLVPQSENGRIKKVAIGTKFRVSMENRVSGIEAAKGAVVVGRRGKHYKIVACPDDRSLIGFFVPLENVDEIDKDKLLQLIVEKFLDDPTGYPLWLQYMVVHFSGMRYQSAHGSWADPRDLLTSLSEKEVEKEITQASEEAIELLSQEKIEVYEGIYDQDNDQGSDEYKVEPPPLALTNKPKWVKKWKDHIKALKSSIRRAKAAPSEGIGTIPLYQVTGAGDITRSSTNILPNDAEFTVGDIFSHQGENYYCIEEYEDKAEYEGHYVLDDDLTLLPDPQERKTLLDLRIDEETYEAEIGDDRQVLADLEKMKEGLDLPDWMWNEIVRMTSLRLKTNNPEWEQPTAEELEARNAYESREYRAMMIEWKKQNLTGWRAEHDRSSRLIVTRAVCNEVAEHIQHLRGHTPPGGLTAKPEWYLRKEREAGQSNKRDKPYLVKPKVKRDFTVGASILWLRFVSREPNAWRIAKPLTLKDGSGLLTSQLNFRKWDQRREMRKAPKKKPEASTDWVYGKASSKFKRHRIVNDKDGRGKPVNQWLRWMHEATVAAVGETADGPVVLTFETALPYEDKRRSTIGVFRHTVSELKYNVSSRTFVGSFVGYVPYGNIPADELKTMLDWDKVLPGNNISEKRKKNYLREVNRWLARLSSNDGDDQKTVKGSPVEVAFSVGRNHKEYILGYEIDAAKNRGRPHQPRVEVKRGTRLYVDKENPVKARLISRSVEFYRVTRCDQEPSGVKGLYIEAKKVIDLPESKEGEDKASKPVIAGKEINLMTIKGNNQKGLPIFTPYIPKEEGGSETVKLKAGMPFRVSTIHYVDKKRPSDRKPDRGDGIINGDAKARCYLIVECPGQSRAIGLFVAEGAIEVIDDKAYKLKITQSNVKEPEELLVRVSPRRGKDFIRLFKPAPGGKKFDRTGDTLLANTEFEVDPKLAFAKGKEFYRIISFLDNKSFPANKKLEGFYVNTKDVTPILRVVAAPKKGRSSIALYRNGVAGGKTLNQGGTIPINTEIVVDPIAEFDQKVGYYRIIEYPDNRNFVGRFVKYEEVAGRVSKAEAGGGADNGAASPSSTPVDIPKPRRSSPPVNKPRPRRSRSPRER